MKNTKDNSLSLSNFIKDWQEDLELKPLSTIKYKNTRITSSRIQKPGLRLIEKKVKLDMGKIQILGKTEVEYLESLDKKTLEEKVKDFSNSNVVCFIFSKGIKPKNDLKKLLDKEKIGLFSTTISTGKLISTLNNILEELFAPKTTFHGVLMDIHRVGVLILGRSGIGKSECSIDLIIQGAKLIADDVVEIIKTGTNKLIGSGPENIQYLMEVRGVGIVNIKDLFGTTSVMEKHEIDMVIELDEWDDNKEYDRLGIDDNKFKILDIELPYIIIPVSPGRNMASIIEIAVRNQILKNSDESFIDILNQ